METTRNAQKQMPHFPLGALQLTMNASDRSFRVSKGVSFHPPSRFSPDRTGVAGERFRQSDRVRSLIPDSYGQG